MSAVSKDGASPDSADLFRVATSGFQRVKIYSARIEAIEARLLAVFSPNHKSGPYIFSGTIAV